MILTYKVRHNMDFSDQLAKAKQVAEFAIKNKFKTSSALVSYIGLKSVISNQILRKYGKNKKIKKVSNVNLTIPNQGIKLNQKDKIISIPSLKYSFEYVFPNDFVKINQIEISKEYIWVSVTHIEPNTIKTDKYIGVDLNVTGHCAVVGNPETGKTYKLGKKANYIHTKYKHIRKYFQHKKLYKMLKKIKQREANIVKDLNHKISKFIVELAVKSKAGIKLEDLKGIRKTKQRKSFRYSLNSWSFYQLNKMIEYKSKLAGILVVKIDPAYTSQICSKCGLLGKRNDKSFKCSFCGHAENADVNASFNIALADVGVSRFNKDRDLLKGNTDIPQEATAV